MCYLEGKETSGETECAAAEAAPQEGRLLRRAGGITITVLAALTMRGTLAQRAATSSDTHPADRIEYVDGVHFATIPSAVVDSSCRATVIVSPGHREVEKEDIFAGLHEGTCMGSLYLLA